MRTVRDIILFLLIMAGLTIGSGLMGVADLRHPLTWVIAAIGMALWYGLSRMIYNSKPRDPDSRT